MIRTVKTGAEVHGVAVATVSGHRAGSDLHHVGGGGPQPLHLGGAVLGRHGVGHGLALGMKQGSVKISRVGGFLMIISRLVSEESIRRLSQNKDE